MALGSVKYLTISGGRRFICFERNFQLAGLSQVERVLHSNNSKKYILKNLIKQNAEVQKAKV